MGDNPDGYPRVYLRDWAPAEIQLFDEYMNKLIQTKNAVVFNKLMSNDFDFSSNSSVDSGTPSNSSLGSDDDESESEDEEDRKNNALNAFGALTKTKKKKKKKKETEQSEDDDKKKKGAAKVKKVAGPTKIITKLVERALVPISESGVILELQIVPGDDDEEKKRKQEHLSKILGGESLIGIDDKDLNEEGRMIKRQQIEELEKRKKREKLLKEIMNNYNEKDKIKTH